MTTPFTSISIFAQQQRTNKDSDSRFSKMGGNVQSGSSPSQSGMGLMHGTQGHMRLVPELSPSIKDDPNLKKRLNLLFNMRKSFLNNSPKDILQSIYDHIEYRCAKTKWNYDIGSLYMSTAFSIRDRMIELWNDTNKIFHERKPKRLYYLSIEFLIGRLLRSNILSLGITSPYTQALNSIGIKLEELVEQEVDMALGNGGLGRLAACFLDSMATLRLPAWGYGLRYQYGMFKQSVNEVGDQVEIPDYWLNNGCPWEIQRNDVKYNVRFFGTIVEHSHTANSMVTKTEQKRQKKRVKKEDGTEEEVEVVVDVPVYVPGVVETREKTFEWKGGEEVQARAYDVPVMGFDTFNTINLRLWESMPRNDFEFDFGSFNKGSYTDAVREKQKSETITQVLYPNDSFALGKELRLKQQYFFVSASLQDIVRRFLTQHIGLQTLEYTAEDILANRGTDKEKLNPNITTLSKASGSLRMQSATSRSYLHISASALDPLAVQGPSSGASVPAGPAPFDPTTLTPSSSSYQYLLAIFRELPNAIVMQCNDTHPVVAIPELLRILMDNFYIQFDDAWAIVQGCFAYTNHTVLPEALEKWSCDLLQVLLPRHMQLIYQINLNFLNKYAAKYPNLMAELSIIEDHPVKQVRMANLAIITSHHVNGVAALHSRLLQTDLFKCFYEIFPEKFLNVTNGVTQRRWLLECNPPLADLYTQTIGTHKWAVSYGKLQQIEKNGFDDAFAKKFAECRHEAKVRLAAVILKETGVVVDTEALFDVQVKRLHEYKRQILNILRCIYEYLRLLLLGREQCLKVAKKVVIFGGKAAPGYFMAKKTIKLINAVGKVVNMDERIEDRLKVVFIPNYNVSLAQVIVPAADISQHISTAGYEASGTSCMKFCMNGALLLGTWDGANIEIAEEVGTEQCYLFGLRTEDIAAARLERKSEDYEIDPRLDHTLRVIEEGMFSEQSIKQLIEEKKNEGKGLAPAELAPAGDNEFSAITTNIRNHDYYLVASDFADYLATHERIERDWQDRRDEWWRHAILTSVRMGKFSSDRSIIDYSEKIWKIKPCIVPVPLQDSASSPEGGAK